MAVKSVRLFSVLALSFLVAGCGPSAPTLSPLVPAEGVVFMDGKPLTDAMVSFIPTGDTEGSGSGGVTDKEGHFVLYTSEVAGARAGGYKVMVSKIIKPDGTALQKGDLPADPGNKETIPKHASDPLGTTLTSSIPKEGNTKLKIEFGSQAPEGSNALPGGGPPGGLMPK